jgi:hypothetical protein
LAEALIAAIRYSKTLSHIDHPHIPIQTLLQSAEGKVIRFNLNKNDENIAYIMGSGDDIPESLIEMGYDVNVITNSDLDKTDFSEFDVVISGIRAYNTSQQLAQSKERLIKFVEKGGTLIDQYNTLWGLKVEHLGPFPFKISRERVSVEEAPVEFVDDEHQLLNYPNKITKKDFEGWVQERGLYFANEWDKRYETIFSSHDPGEEPKEGGMLYARYGDGHYIYSGYSWFRELPAGVSGAYRLFVNMISVGSNNEKRAAK